MTEGTSELNSKLGESVVEVLDDDVLIRKSLGAGDFSLPLDILLSE